MTIADLQLLCEVGQQQLMLMDYLAAEMTLVEAERVALDQSDFDTLGRLYMPLQEARRQRRQRCGEGVVNLHLVASGPNDPVVDPNGLIEEYPQGQLLIAGWGSIEPAVRFRELAWQRQLYVETYLGATYPMESGAHAVVIVPLAFASLPTPTPRPIGELLSLLPAHSIALPESDLPELASVGTSQTYAFTMALWERLHTPFLVAADAQPNPFEKMDGYRQSIAVDYACELAHQKLSAVARAHARSIRVRF